MFILPVPFRPDRVTLISVTDGDARWNLPYRVSLLNLRTIPLVGERGAMRVCPPWQLSPSPKRNADTDGGSNWGRIAPRKWASVPEKHPSPIWLPEDWRSYWLFTSEGSGQNAAP